MSSNVIEHFEVVNHSILLIGESRSGKTTFKKLLSDANYCTQMEVLRGTINPETETHLFKINDTFLNLTIVDTPGFGEVSEHGSRSDLALRDMMSECIKKDVTRVSMVLLTLDGQGGFTRAKLNMVKKICMFLGKDAMKNVYLLVTHFEGRGEAQEQEWIKTFKSTASFGFLRKAINNFIFTGALNETQHKNEKTRDEFLEEQSRRTNYFFNQLTTCTPYNILSSSSVRTHLNMLSMAESVASRTASLRPVFLELEQSRVVSCNARKKLQKMYRNRKQKKHVTEICKQYEWVETGAFLFNNEYITDNYIVDMLNSHNDFAEKLESLYVFVAGEHNKYVAACDTLTRELEELEWTSF